MILLVAQWLSGLTLEIYFSNPTNETFIWTFPTVIGIVKIGPLPASFYFQQLIVNIILKVLPITGFEPWTSGIESDRSANLTTTTMALLYFNSLSLNNENNEK